MTVWVKYEARNLRIMFSHTGRLFLLQLIIFRVLQFLYGIEDRIINNGHFMRMFAPI